MAYTDKWPKEGVGEHLRGIREIHDKCMSGIEISDERYAAIAFKLVELANGKNVQANVEEISRYIQDQHRNLKDTMSWYKKIQRDIVDWVLWANIWTKHKE